MDATELMVLIERDRRFPLLGRRVLEVEMRERTSSWCERGWGLRAEGGQDESSLEREQQGRVVGRRVATEELRVAAEIPLERVFGRSEEVGVRRRKESCSRVVQERG